MGEQGYRHKKEGVQAQREVGSNGPGALFVRQPAQVRIIEDRLIKIDEDGQLQGEKPDRQPHGQPAQQASSVGARPIQGGHHAG